MEIWLDSGDITEIEKYYSLGILTGVTTNPSILAAEAPSNPLQTIKLIIDKFDVALAVQVIAEDTDNMVNQVFHLQKISQKIIPKIPVTFAGLKAIYQLSRKNIATMATAIFHPKQVLQAMTAGASYAAPYLSHIEKNTANSIGYLKNMQAIINAGQTDLKLIVASVKNTNQILKSATIGAKAITLPPAILEQYYAPCQETEEAIAKFGLDWQKVDDDIFLL